MIRLVRFPPWCTHDIGYGVISTVTLMTLRHLKVRDPVQNLTGGPYESNLPVMFRIIGYKSSEVKKFSMVFRL